MYDLAVAFPAPAAFDSLVLYLAAGADWDIRRSLYLVPPYSFTPSAGRSCTGRCRRE